MSKLLKVDHLRVSLKKDSHVLVRDISFSLGRGESLVILGQSGSGKTMTCHSIMGLLDPKRFEISGGIQFNDTNLLTCSKKECLQIYGGEIAMIPQNPMTALDPSIKIGKQMAETLFSHTSTKKGELAIRLNEALLAAGLNEPERICRSYPYTLSGGMLQRVTIAMALMVHAKLIVADEPTTALDVAHRNATVNSFLKLREQGASILLVTHDFAVAAQLGGKILVMKEGIVLEQGEVEEILRHPKAEYTKALLKTARLSGNPNQKEERLC